jgi:hypothetical protein
MTTNDDRIQHLFETYFRAVGRARHIQAGEEAGDDAAIAAALDLAEEAEREAARTTADTAAGAEAQMAILQDLAALLGDTTRMLADTGTGPKLVRRVLEAHGHAPLPA